jgi:hypothetical protein
MFLRGFEPLISTKKHIVFARFRAANLRENTLFFREDSSRRSSPQKHTAFHCAKESKIDDDYKAKESKIDDDYKAIIITP